MESVPPGASRWDDLVLYYDWAGKRSLFETEGTWEIRLEYHWYDTKLRKPREAESNILQLNVVPTDEHDRELVRMMNDHEITYMICQDAVCSGFGLQSTAASRREVWQMVRKLEAMNARTQVSSPYYIQLHFTLAWAYAGTTMDSMPLHPSKGLALLDKLLTLPAFPDMLKDDAVLLKAKCYRWMFKPQEHRECVEAVLKMPRNTCLAPAKMMMRCLSRPWGKQVMFEYHQNWLKVYAKDMKALGQEAP